MSIHDRIAELATALVEEAAFRLDLERIDRMQELSQHLLMHLARARGLALKGEALDEDRDSDDLNEEEEDEYG